MSQKQLQTCFPVFPPAIVFVGRDGTPMQVFVLKNVPSTTIADAINLDTYTKQIVLRLRGLVRVRRERVDLILQPLCYESCIIMVKRANRWKPYAIGGDCDQILRIYRTTVAQAGFGGVGKFLVYRVPVQFLTREDVIQTP